jgi:hypothetical protein
MFDMEGRRDLIDRIATAVAGLASEERDHWPAPALSERVLELLAVQERLHAELLRLVGAWDRRRAWEADGALSATSWITHRAPMARRHATTMLGSARLTARHDATAAALATGAVSTAHVEQLARVVTKDRAGLYPDHETELLNAAASLPVADFAKVTATWRCLADDHLATDHHAEQYEQRRFHLADTFHGAVAVDGIFDSVGGATLKAAVDDVANLTHHPGDTRSLPQRQADALVELADRYLKGTQPSGRSPVNLNVVVDAGTLTNQPVDLVKARCEIEGAGVVTRAALEQLACDCTVTRIVTAGISHPRHGAPDPGRHSGATPCVDGAGSALPIPRLPPAGALERRPPQHLLARRWPHQPRQPGAAVPPPPHHGAHHRMEHHPPPRR